MLAVAGVAAALAFFTSRDDATTDVPPAVQGPGTVEQTPERLDPVLRTGNIVIEYPTGGDTDTRPAIDITALNELARDVTGAAATDPELRRAGQEVELRGVSHPGIVAYAYDRVLRVESPSDPRLREFVEFWLGRGG